MDGTLAVSIFFVLSGETLSFPYFSGGGERAARRLAIKRYVRLTIPIAVICALVYALHYAGWDFTRAATPIVRMEDWMGAWFRFDFSAGHFFKYVLLDVYTGIKRGQAIDPFLWTMKIELPGSILVFVVLFTFSRFRGGWIALTAVTLLFLAALNAQIGCVLTGVFFAAARCAGLFERLRERKGAALWSWTAVAVLAAIDGLLQWRDLDISGAKALIAIALLFAVYCNPALTAFFRNATSRLMGTLSFPLYLVQFLVIISLTAWLVVRIGQDGLTAGEGLMIALASLAACMLAAFAFQPVETLTRHAGNAVVRLAEGAFARKT